MRFGRSACDGSLCLRLTNHCVAAKTSHLSIAAKALTRMHEDMVLSYWQGDKPAYFKINQRIHDDIVAASGNKHLIEAHRRCTRRLRRIRYISNL